MDITQQPNGSAVLESSIPLSRRIEMLRHVPVFAALPMQMRRVLAENLREESYFLGDVVVAEGDSGDRLYLVVEGKAEVETSRDGRTIKLATLEPGALFGELALISPEHRREATVTSSSPLLTLTLGMKEFERLEADYPEMRKIVGAHASREHVSKYVHSRVLYNCHFHDPRRELLFLSSLSFFLAFLAVRLLVNLIRNNVGPFHNVQAGGTHIHHLVWGILLLVLVGYGFLLLSNVSVKEERKWHRVAAVLYGIGAALTLDEFALWLKLADVYFTQEGQKSIQVVLVFGGLLMIGVWGGPFMRGLYHHLIRRHPKRIPV